MRRLVGIYGMMAAIVCCVSAPPALAVEIRDLDRLRETYAVTSFEKTAGYADRLKQRKIAVIDNGFGRLEDLPQELPASVFRLVARYDKSLVEKYHLGSYEDQQALNPFEDHGRRMAMIVWGMAGYRTEVAPQIFLLNGNGLTNVARAVRYAIENKIEVILYSHNWEYGGNFDGRGFVNRIVSQATSAGILWVNAAGNYRGKVYNGPVTGAVRGWARLGPDGQGLRLKSGLDKNPVRIILSWNRNNEEETEGTDSDLDFYVYDENETLVMRSELTQIRGGPGVERPLGKSFVPREMVTGELSRNRTGYYRIRVAIRSGGFDATDRLRITVIAPRGEIEFPDATEGFEIMVPGDHPAVITVGDRSAMSARGPTADGRAKPDILAPLSRIAFTDGEMTMGTSNAAACIAGTLIVAKAWRETLSRAEALALLSAIIRSG